MNAPDPFEEMFSTFQTEAFRFEHLPEYHVDPAEEAGLIAYLTGEPCDPFPDGNLEWHESLQKWTSTGRRIIRLRMVPERWSPYINFELEWGYPSNAQHGEEIFLVDEQRLSSHPDYDFWLFDRTHTLRMAYTATGEYEGAFLATPTTEELRLRDEVMKIAMPLGAVRVRDRHARFDVLS